MSTDEAIGSSNVIQNIFRSCSSIQKRARSWPTIIVSSTKIDRNKRQKLDSYLSFSAEQAESNSLDRQILDYVAVLRRLRIRNQESDKNFKSTMTTTGEENSIDKEDSDEANKSLAKIVSEKQQAIRDILENQQREHLLVSRTAMSQAASIVWGKDQLQSRNDNPTATILQEAIQCRNQLTKKVLATKRKVDALHLQLGLLSQKGRLFQSKIRETWTKLLSIKRQLEQSTRANPDTENNPPATHTQMQRMSTESLMLKRFLADLISQSGIDLCSDDRLRDTLSMLE